ncbi:MAG: hypothetical protein II304_03175, partial [Bacteroidales bacterium]|nr:hypothetical protein [Bacteroidales bacterium]
GRIGIIYNERYLFNYAFVKMMMNSLPYYDKEIYVIENKRNEPILKFFVGEEFAGLVMSIDKKGKELNKNT